jgi:hypothetical protein
MADKFNKKKKELAFSFIPALQPLSLEEKKELEMRIYIAICQSNTKNRDSNQI